MPTRLRVSWAKAFRRASTSRLSSKTGPARGNLAASAVATAPADGYALFLGLISTHAINVHLYQQLPYDPIKDFQPIGRVAQAPLLLVVPPTLPVKSVSEFIAHAKANPGKLNYGSAGNGSASHLAMSMFSTMAGIQLVHVPYKGTGPLKVDLFTGLLQGYFDAQVSAMGDIQSGKVRLIGVGSRGRLPAFPDIAPISETVAGYEFNTWYGLFAPAGLSSERVRFLNRTLNQVLAEPSTRTRFDSQGLEATLNPRSFRSVHRVRNRAYGQGREAHWRSRRLIRQPTTFRRIKNGQRGRGKRLGARTYEGLVDQPHVPVHRRLQAR